MAGLKRFMWNQRAKLSPAQKGQWAIAQSKRTWDGKPYFDGFEWVKKCEHCRTGFRTIRELETFCSPECRVDHAKHQILLRSQRFVSEIKRHKANLIARDGMFREGDEWVIECGTCFEMFRSTSPRNTCEGCEQQANKAFLTRLKPCANCKEHLLLKSDQRQKYCSLDCRKQKQSRTALELAQAQRQKEAAKQKCEECKKLILGKRNGTKFCSPSCRQKAWYKSQKTSTIN